MAAVLSVEKAIDVLEAVAASGEGVGTRELARRLGLNVATVHNIAGTFEGRGYLRRVGGTRRFALGPRLMLLGRHDQYLQAIAGIGRPEVERLAEELGESVMLGMLGQGRLVKLHYVPSDRALRVDEPEDLGPIAHCTALGKIVLAHMPDDQLEDYFKAAWLKRFTPHTLTSRRALRAALAEVRQRGYSTTRDELCEGISAVAVSVADPWGRPVAALGASAPTVRMDKPRHVDHVRRALQAGADRLNAAWAREVRG